MNNYVYACVVFLFKAELRAAVFLALEEQEKVEVRGFPQTRP